MMTIHLSEIEMRGTDADGRYAMARGEDGEWVGVSRYGEDEPIRDLHALTSGDRVEVGIDGPYTVLA